MFAVRVTYLTRRVFAARFDDGDRKQSAEWPPEPGRLFAAMVSAWAETGSDDAGRAFLEWVERQPAPEIHYPDGREWHMPATYVPVNDDSALETRTRKDRSFPALRLSKKRDRVEFVWPVELPAEHGEAADEIFRSISYLGHSTTLVWIRRAAPSGDFEKRLMPSEAGAERIRVPSPGRLEALEKLYERWQARPDMKAFRPNRGSVAAYAEASEPGPPTVSGAFRQMVMFQFEKGVRFPPTAARVVTAALRAETMRRMEGRASLWVVSGHAPDSTVEEPKALEAAHAAFVPLIDAGFPRSSGVLLGVAAVLPYLEEGERTEVLEALGAVDEMDVRGQPCRVRMAAPNGPFTVQAVAWTDPCESWATVTPLVFDRYPKDPEGDEAREVVALACERIGLPRPVRVELDAYPFLPGGTPAFHYLPSKPKNGKPQRWHTHARVWFGVKVKGPVILGAGRYYGYGICRPVREERRG